MKKKREYSFTVPFFVVCLVAPGIDDGPLGPFKAAGGISINARRGGKKSATETTFTFKTPGQVEEAKKRVLAAARFEPLMTKRGLPKPGVNGVFVPSRFLDDGTPVVAVDFARL